MSSRAVDRRMLWGFSAFLVMVLTATAAAAFELPPLVQPASGEHHYGKIVWVDLVTPDLISAKKFYGDLFGWTFNDIQVADRQYSVALLDGAPIAGLVERAIPSAQRRQSAWLTFLSVPDVRAAERVTLAHGGKVLSQPRSYAKRGWQAVFADPQGAVFAVLQSSSGDPQDVLAAPGQWIWSSLMTRDPDTDAAFYQTLFGYEAFDLGSEDGSEHVLLSSDNYARASSNPLPRGALHPHWLNFVRVASATDTVARVQALGGRVLVSPYADRHGGLAAVVADPAGAPFGLLEWADSDSKEIAK